MTQAAVKGTQQALPCAPHHFGCGCDLLLLLCGDHRLLQHQPGEERDLELPVKVLKSDATLPRISNGISKRALKASFQNS